MYHSGYESPSTTLKLLRLEEDRNKIYNFDIYQRMGNLLCRKRGKFKRIAKFAYSTEDCDDSRAEYERYEDEEDEQDDPSVNPEQQEQIGNAEQATNFYLPPPPTAPAWNPPATGGVTHRSTATNTTRVTQTAAPPQTPPRT